MPLGTTTPWSSITSTPTPGTALPTEPGSSEASSAGWFVTGDRVALTPRGTLIPDRRVFQQNIFDLGGLYIQTVVDDHIIGPAMVDQRA